MTTQHITEDHTAAGPGDETDAVPTAPEELLEEEETQVDSGSPLVPEAHAQNGEAVTGVAAAAPDADGTSAAPPQRGQQQEKPDRPKSRRGFAAMDPALVREIASKGGKAAHAAGTAHEFNSEEARLAGRKGGQAAHRHHANNR